MSRLLETLVRTAYADVWALVDPATATRSRLEDAFRHESPAAQRKRMVACFVGLCRMAGIRPADQPRPGRRPGSAGAGRRQTAGPVSSRARREAASAPAAPAPPEAAQRADTFNRLFAKLPDYDANWSDEIKAAWFAAFSRFVDAADSRRGDP